MAKGKGGSSQSVPRNKEAEAQVVGMILNNPELVRQTTLRSDSFFEPAPKEIFGACCELVMLDKPVDVQPVFAATGIDYDVIKKMKDDADAEFYFSGYEEQIKLAHDKRTILNQAPKIANELYQSDDIAQICDRLVQLVQGIPSYNSHSNIPVFKGGTTELGEEPIYHLLVELAGEEKVVEFDPKDLDSQTDFNRKLRNAFKVNATLPEKKEDWKAFITQVVAKTTNKQGAMSEHDEILEWVKSWFASASETEIIDSMQHSYIKRDGYRYFKIGWMKRWINEQSRVPYTSRKIWSCISEYGAVQRKNIRLHNKVGSFYGVPESFINPTTESFL